MPLCLGDGKTINPWPIVFVPNFEKKMFVQRPNQLIMGGLQDKIICLDLEKLKENQLLDSGMLIVYLRLYYKSGLVEIVIV